MCGIGCLARSGTCCGADEPLRKCQQLSGWWSEALAVLRNRGPDACHHQSITFNTSTEHVSCMPVEGLAELVASEPCCEPSTAAGGPSHSVDLSLCGCVLHLRGGGCATPQPLVNSSTGDSLLWNGEVFDGIEVSPEVNDGAVLLDSLSKDTALACSREEHIVSVLSRVRGPWALVFWQADERRLWFGRDYVGRRSLLWSHCQGVFALSSVSGPVGASHPSMVWSEVPAIGIFTMQFSATPPSDGSSQVSRHNLTLHKWSDLSEDTCTARLEASPYIELSLHPSLELSCPVGPFNNTVPTGDFLSSCVVTREAWDFVDGASAGKDSSCDACTATVPTMTSDNGVMTCGTCAERLASADVERSKKLAVEFRAVLGKAVHRRVSSIPWRGAGQTHGEATAEQRVGGRTRAAGHPESDGSVGPAAASAVCSDGCSDGCCDLQDTTASTVASAVPAAAAPPSRVAVLFSGGVDCMVLAALAGRDIPPDEPIDLINVAFEQIPKSSISKAKHGGKKASATPSADAAPGDARTTSTYDVPDRKTALSGIHELDQRRLWRFIEVNVTKAELEQWRTDRVCHLVAPCSSILDDSIGSAIWFAARGRGRLLRPVITADGHQDMVEICHDYVSPAKVVLVGMGADEQLAGYSRHRQKFLHHGWQGLLNEVFMDISRISHRNLGRDDRVISDHGREARFPFLDESVMTFLNSLAIQDKADLRLDRGLGEKLLLRNVARSLGLSKASGLPKRAIQFGSRIANSAEKGSDKSARLSAASA